jgi:Acetyltransferases, including N-acetylases of ribosomal proteins
MDNYKLFLAQNREIETERLLLRPVTLADAEDLYEYASDEENVYYVTFDTYQSLDDAYFSIANYFMDQPLGKYGIEVKEEGKLLARLTYLILALRKCVQRLVIF